MKQSLLEVKISSGGEEMSHLYSSKGNSYKEEIKNQSCLLS